MGQLVKSRSTRLPGVSGGQLSMFPRICRPCVPPSVVEGINHSTEARLPDGSAPVPGKPARPGYCQDNAQIPVSVPWEPSGISRWLLLSRRHSSMSRMGLVFDTQRFATYNCTQRNQGGHGRPTLSLLDIRTGRRRNNQPSEATTRNLRKAPASDLQFAEVPVYAWR